MRKFGVPKGVKSMGGEKWEKKILIRVWCLIVFISFSLLESESFASADFCEFATLKEAKEFGWQSKETAILEISRDSIVGDYALRVTGQKEGEKYGGIILKKEIDLSSARPGDKITFFIKENSANGFYLNIGLFAGGNIYRHFPLKKGKWNKIELDLDFNNWTKSKTVKKWGKTTQFSFYSRSFDSPREYLIIDGFSISLGGKEISLEKLTPLRITNWDFPNETERAWFLGNRDVAWAISKKTGQLLGAWNVKTKERYLDKSTLP